MYPRLTLAQHLGLYTTFHQAVANRRMHAVGTPLVLLTGMVLLAYVAPVTGSVLHAGTAASVLLMLAFLPLDVGVALTMGGVLLAMAGVASVLVGAVPAVVLVPAALVLHGLAWFGVVVIGHVTLEPMVETASGAVDSNEYFRRRLVLAQNTGANVSVMDAFIQFAISPAAEVVELFEAIGLRSDLIRDAATQRERVTARLALNAALFA